MNAKEFAHELEKAASFIRQQQAEIEALKQIIDANNLNQNIGQFVKPTNEPVAWIGETLMGRQYINGQKDELPVGTALYTHPVNPKYDPETGEPLIDGYPLFSGLPHPVKELTDEEIANTWDDVRKDATLKPSMKNMQDFARAILRKAQEK